MRLAWKSGDGFWPEANGSHAAAGRFRLRVWWDAMQPKAGPTQRWCASFGSWRLKQRFETEAEAQEAVEKVAEKTLRAALESFERM